MDLNKLTGGQSGLPEELAELVQRILEGRVLQFAVAWEEEGEMVYTDIQILDPEKAHRFTMVGALDVLKDDYKAFQMQSWEDGDKGDDGEDE